MKIIALADQKGGVGKTTSAVSLASLLNAAGHRTLLIDADSQGNSTDTYRAKTEGTATLYDLIIDDEPCTLEEAIQETEYGDIIAADNMLVMAESKLSGEDAFLKLKNALKELKGYEYVIIDTNPALNAILCNVLTASDEVIIPMKPDRYTILGISQFTDTFSSIKKSLNRDLSIRGLLLVDVDTRVNVDRLVQEEITKIAKEIGTVAFSTYIRHTAKCREAQLARMPLVLYSPRCTAARDYKAFVEELLGEEQRWQEKQG